MEKIAILTSGGDAPGMNCAVRSVVRCAHFRGLQVFGITRGYQGLIDQNYRRLGPRDVSNIIARGGTFLKTARSDDFMQEDGRRTAFRNLRREGVNGLIVIGGNGSFQGASVFHREFNFPVIGIPGTIDNDILGTQRTLGFDTALNTAMDAIDKIKDTAISMDRIFLIEVMGRQSGAIATFSALAGGAEDVIMPGESRNIQDIIQLIEKGRKTGKRSWIIIVAEGSGWTEKLAAELREFVEEVRVTIIGHIQRGGSPSAFDRFLGAIFGRTAVDGLLSGKNCHAVGWRNDAPVLYDLEEACRPKGEDFDSLVELNRILT